MSNSISTTGNLGRDSVIRYTANGKPVLSFSIGSSVGFGEREQTLWFDCSVWGDRGEKLEQHLKKGQRVTVHGELSTREHDGKTYLQINVDRLDFASSAREGRQATPQQQGFRERQQAAPQKASEGIPGFEDDDIPF